MAETEVQKKTTKKDQDSNLLILKMKNNVYLILDLEKLNEKRRYSMLVYHKKKNEFTHHLGSDTVNTQASIKVIRQICLWYSTYEIINAWKRMNNEILTEQQLHEMEKRAEKFILEEE